MHDITLHRCVTKIRRAITAIQSADVRYPMTTDVASAREALHQASDAADGEIQQHINSIDEGLMELAEGDKMTEADADPDRVAELEEKLSALSAEVDDQAIVSHIGNALDHLDAAEELDRS
jgi:DNA repair ATPase RecN